MTIPQEFLGADGRVDVTRIMESIRRDLRTEDADVRARRLLVSCAEAADMDPEFVARLFSPAGGWNLVPDYPVETHRRGLEGWLVTRLKGLVRPIVRLYTDVLFRRQAEINLTLLRTCQALAREVVRLEDSRRGTP